MHHSTHSCWKENWLGWFEENREDGKSFASWCQKVEGTLFSLSCVQKLCFSTRLIPLTAKGWCTRTSVYNNIARSNSYSSCFSIKASMQPGKRYFSQNIYVIIYCTINGKYSWLKHDGSVQSSFPAQQECLFLLGCAKDMRNRVNRARH